MVRRSIGKIRAALTSSAILLCVGACGSEHDFQGKGKTVDANPYAGINWMWQCDEADYDKNLKSTATQINLQGEGPHKIDRLKGEGSPLKVAGNVCAGESLDRHVVFIIDVSSSMRDIANIGADPVQNNTCGRLEAVKNVISSVSASGHAKFGLVTFSNVANAGSSGLFSTEAELFADLLAKNTSFPNITELVCAGILNTNYQAGLIGGGALLDGEGGDAAREIYFISDGEPSIGLEGAAQAAALRVNTTIATVMVGSSSDDVLRNQIASVDERGQPLHARAESSSDLADVLAQLSVNHIEKGSFSYRTIGSKDWQTTDIRDKIEGISFEIDPFIIDASKSDGIEIEINFSDRFGHDQQQRGKILWNGGPF